MNQKREITKDDIVFFDSNLLRAISDEHRQAIILILGKKGEMCVNNIVEYFDMSRPSVSHHLQILKRANVVKSRKVGKNVFYRLNTKSLKGRIKKMLKILETVKN